MPIYPQSCFDVCTCARVVFTYGFWCCIATTCFWSPAMHPVLGPMKAEYSPVILPQGTSTEWFSRRKSPSSSVLTAVWIPEANRLVDLQMGSPCGTNKQQCGTTDRDNGNKIGAKKRPSHKSLRLVQQLTRSLVRKSSSPSCLGQSAWLGHRRRVSPSTPWCYSGITVVVILCV